MRRGIRGAVAGGFLFFLLCLTMPSLRGMAIAEEAAVAQSDREFVQAVAKGDAAAVGKLLDPDFTWTDGGGKMRTRAEVIRSLPKLALGDEAGAHEQKQIRNQAEAILVDREKTHVLRIWAKRGAAWRLLVYQEVVLGSQTAKTPDVSARECDNPCKTVPYKPKNEKEQAIVAAWEALETSVATHDAGVWAQYIADEFTMVSSTSDHALTKNDRVSTLNLQKQIGRVSIPSPVISVQIFDFGDTAVMTTVQQPSEGKPVRATRMWIRREGKWMISIGFQTTIEAEAGVNS
jgi:Domain of unknown function (DUF4440)